MKANILLLTLFIVLFAACSGGSGEDNLDNTTRDNQKNLTTTKTTPAKKDHTKFNQTTIRTSAPTKDVKISGNTLFSAEGKHGVEIMKIGFSDTISSELITTIKNINAKSIKFSKDKKTLLVEQENSKIALFDIRDINHPKYIGEKSKINLHLNPTNKNHTYEYIPKGKDGMEIWYIANPSKKERVGRLKSSNCFDIVLIDDDKKALIATGSVGIKLLKLDNPKIPNPIATYRIKGASVTGLSLNDTKDILFAATGKNGIMVFNLDILLYKMEH